MEGDWIGEQRVVRILSVPLANIEEVTEACKRVWDQANRAEGALTAFASSCRAIGVELAAIECQPVIAEINEIGRFKHWR